MTGKKRSDKHPEEYNEESVSSDEFDTDDPEDKVKKEKGSNIVFMTAIIFIIVVIGVLIYTIIISKDDIHPSEVVQYTYNGFSVMNISGQWYTQIQIPGKSSLHTVEMRTGPRQVESIPAEAGIVDKIKGSSKIYLTTDPDSGSKTVIAMIEIGRITGEKYDIYNIETHGVLTRSYENQTTADCDNASKETSVVLFMLGNETRIYEKDYCIFVQGVTEDDIILAADKLGYMLLGIIKE